MSKDRPKPPSSPENLTPHLRERLEKLVPRLLELGLGSVHSAETESDGGSDADVDCFNRLEHCRAVCCSYRFALTEDEVAEGKILWDREKPHFIARGGNGYCSHHDEKTRRCRIWDDRPLRCRRYDCRRLESFWADAERHTLRRGTFDHLPEEGA